MGDHLTVLLSSAVAIALTHTLMGPDHYIPFIVMARAGDWSRRKTYWITTLCGVGHVLSSVLLGLIGVALGIALGKLEEIESSRGALAAWGLILFGTGYGLWGLYRAWRRRGHPHPHPDQVVSMTPWILFTIFAFGPCEPLIPLLMFPAAEHSLWGVALVSAIFGAVTIATMLLMVALGVRGVSLLRWGWMERYTHALAGLVIAASGLAIQFLGL